MRAAKVAGRRARLNAIRRAAGCVDCGTTEGLLHFDHRDPATKLFTIGDQAHGRSWQSILTEVAKCDVRCAACHATRHDSLKGGSVQPVRG